MPENLSVTFVLETTFEVVEKLSAPHKTNTKTIYSQATLIETMGKKYLLFPGHMLAQAQVWLIKEDSSRICLNQEHIVFSRVLNLAYLAAEHLPDDILESNKAIQLADNLLESGDNVQTLDFQLSDEINTTLNIKGDFSCWYFSWHNPKFPLNRLIHSEHYLHSRATLVLPSGNIAPLAGKITGYKPGLVGAPVVNSKDELIGIIGVGNQRSSNGYSLIMPSSIIELWIQRQISHPEQMIEFTELPLGTKYYSEYTDVGGHFHAAGLFVTRSGCEAIKPTQYVTHIDGYPFNNLGELQIAPNQPSQKLRYFLFQKELRGEGSSCQLTVIDEEKPVRVELLRDPERHPIVLSPLPVGKLPYLIIGPFLLSTMYHKPYVQPPALVDDFGKKRELVHIVNVAQGRPHYQRYRGFVVDTINTESVTSLCDLARRFDKIAPGESITLTCYVNLRTIFGGNVLTNFISNLEREHPEFTHPDKILYSLCCKKEAPGIFSEFKEQGFESDRSSCLPTPNPLVTEFKLEDISGSSPRQVLASSLGQQADIKENSSTDEITNELLERANVEIKACSELSSPVSGDPLYPISFVRKIPGTVIKFEAQYFIVTALRGLTIGFYSAQIEIEILGQKETLFLDRRNAIFDPSCNLAFLRIPREVIQEYGSENISAVDLSLESFDFARRDFFYQAKVPVFQAGTQERNGSFLHKKFKGTFIGYSLHDNSQGGRTFCIEAVVSFTTRHELRGGLIHDRIGQMVGVVVAANHKKGILQLIPHEIIRRSLQKQSISDGNAPMIVRAVILPPPIRTQALLDFDQQAHFTRGSTSTSGALIVHAEFFQSADDPVLTGGFKPPSRLRGCLLTAVKIMDERDELHEYKIFFDGRTDHPVYGMVDWRSIFSLHVITSITVSIYNPVTQRNFDEKFSIKEAGILTCLGANLEYTELADYQMLTSLVKPFVSNYWYPDSLINLFVMRDHYPGNPGVGHKILPGATVLGYRVVRCMTDGGQEVLEGIKTGRYVFSDDREILRLERVQGDVPIFMFPRSSFPVGTVEYKQEGNLERYSIVQLIVVDSVNSKYSGRIDSEVFLPYTRDNSYTSRASGFVIRWQTQLYIVTNAHAVVGMNVIAVNLPTHVHRMMPEAIKKVVICRAWDLALIPIPESSPLKGVLIPLSLAEKSVHLEKVVAKGYPAGDGAQVMTLPVTQVKKIFEPSVVDSLVPGLMLHYAARLEPGSSGSPLIDCKGKVVGVHSEGYSKQEYKQGIPVESLIKLLFYISRENICGDVFLGQFLFQLPLILPSQRSKPPLPLLLTEDVALHNLKQRDEILTIDGLQVDGGKVSSSGVTMFFHQYAHTQLSGYKFPITVRRDGQVYEENISSFPFHGGANHSRYYSYLSAPCLTVILSGCMLTEHYVAPSLISRSKKPGFVSKLEKQQLIQLSWYCCNLQGAEGETACERTLPIDLSDRINWFVCSINNVPISTFTDVFSAVNQSNDETIDLILQGRQSFSQEKISIKLPRLTDQQLHDFIEHHKLKSMHVYSGSGLIVSEDIMNNGMSVNLHAKRTP